MPAPQRRLLAVLSAAALAIGVAACGGGNGGGGGGNANAGATPASSGANPSSSSLESQFVHVVNEVGPRVVQIETGRALGSGIVFDDKGDIVTNAHVVAEGSTLHVTLPDGRRYPAKLVGSFPPNDIAVVRAEGANVKPATFADSSKLAVGDIVLAIGNPLGLRSSVTNGIISAVGRTVSEPGGATLPAVIQTSAPINPGNSGGALVDLAGQVVGIPTLAAVDPQLGAAPGIGFAIPSSTAKDLAQQIIAHGHVVNSHRAFLGVQLATGYATGSGAIVAAVQPGGPAASAGIRPGDVIVGIAGQATPGPAAVGVVLAKLKPGQTVPVKIARPGGGQTTVKVKLGELR